jgi:hypothetical protein
MLIPLPQSLRTWPTAVVDTNRKNPTRAATPIRSAEEGRLMTHSRITARFILGNWF